MILPRKGVYFFVQIFKSKKLPRVGIKGVPITEGGWFGSVNRTIK